MKNQICSVHLAFITNYETEALTYIKRNVKKSRKITIYVYLEVTRNIYISMYVCTYFFNFQRKKKKLKIHLFIYVYETINWKDKYFFFFFGKIEIKLVIHIHTFF